MKVRFCACGQSMQNYIPHCLAIICYLRAPSKSAVAAAKHRRQINNHHRLTLQAKRKSHRMHQVFSERMFIPDTLVPKINVPLSQF